jgi:uncharacterized lipoprotein YddW (UPF0748 family)
MSPQPTRRTFIKTSAAALCAVGVTPAIYAQTQGAAEQKFILSAPLTHSDWILKPNIPWGFDGVKHMLDVCKSFGFSRIYWRALDGGRAMYNSKIVPPAEHWDADSFWSPQTAGDRALMEGFTKQMSPAERKAILDKVNLLKYEDFDSLEAAIDYGHSIGVQIHAWVSINEDDHGWGLVSSFAREHPQFRWVKRDGRIYHSQLSFAFEEVRNYKLAILKELLAYNLDGIFLDWIRTGDVRDNPQTDKAGVADSGYEQPNVDAFKKRFNKDPHDVPSDNADWVAARAAPQTVFMREARRVTQGKPLCVMVGHPWHYRGEMDPIAGNLKGLLLDVSAWAKEGLMDSAVAAGYYRPGGSAELAYNALKGETAGKCEVWLYGWIPTTVADIDRDCGIAAKVGAKQILFWEADYLDDRKNAAELKAALSRRAL